MQANGKEWLVRTRTGEVLGPFTAAELVAELDKKTFTPDDEICPSRGYWVSAQGLATRERDEHTLTSTRTHTVTRAQGTVGGGAVGNAATKEDLTPTPDFDVPPIHQVKPDPTGGDHSGDPKAMLRPPGGTPIPRFVGGIVVLMLVVFGFWTIAVLMKNPAKPTAQKSLVMGASHSTFLNKISYLISTGDQKTALKLLTEHHQKEASKSEVEYLIPYAGLLIKEEESIPRAREILETLLKKEGLANEIKAQAHHWLGYSYLATGEGDMGESHFLEALQINPRDPATQYNLGRAYLKMDKYNFALEYLQLAELQNWDLWLVHIYKGRAKEALGFIDEATQSYKNAIGVAPDRWISYLYYALFLTNQKKLDEAQAVLEKMLTRDPSFDVNSPAPFPYFQEPTNYNEYLRAFNRVMAKAPTEKREWGRMYLGYLLRGSNGPEAKKIESLYEKGGVWMKLLALKERLDRDVPAGDLRKILLALPENLKPFGYHAYVLRAEAQLRLEAYDHAAADINAALVIEPHAASAIWVQYQVLLRQGETVGAKSALNSLLSYHPNFIPAIVSAQETL